MKLWWSLIMVTGVALSIMAITATAESDLWEEDDKEVLVRTVRGTKERGSSSSAPACRYTKGAWSECDAKTNTRTRHLTLKKGDKSCNPTKTISKKCKNACRYEKGSFGGCINLSMTRMDKLKATSDATCEPTRNVTKPCKPENNTKKSNKGGDRSNKKTGKQ